MKHRAVGMLLCAFSVLAYAGDGGADEPQVVHTVTKQDVRILFGLGYTTFTVQGNRLSGAGLDAGTTFGLTPRWGIGLSIRQGFTNSFSALFTALDINITLAITSNMILEKANTTVDGRRIVATQSFNSGGLSAQLYLNQYFINTTDSILPFPGIGAGLVYDLPSLDTTNFSVGVRVDRLSNDVNSLYPFEAFLRCSFWM